MRNVPFVIVLLAALGAGCGEVEAPIFPSYAADVAPIMGARCIRCHGGGGMLNKDPDATPVSGVQMPALGNFTQLGPDANGIPGLMAYTGPTGGAQMMTFINTGPMPPPPAPPLTEREKTIIQRWVNNPAP